MGVDFIEFPGLGIKLNISPLAFELGPFRVHWYGIIIAAAILVALSLAIKHTKRFGIKEDNLIDMFLLALPVSIVFARLFFVVFKWDMFKNDLMGIFRIWEGGVAIYGAVIGALLSVYIYSRIKKIDMWILADFTCVYLPLAQAIGRWGNFANQELYGTNTNLPWGMTGSIIQTFPDAGVNPDIPVHPTFLYESIWNILVFFVLLKIRKINRIKGGVFSWYLLLYSFGRFMSEFLRVDDFQAGSIRYNQVFAAVVFIGAAIFLLIAYGKKKQAVMEAGNGIQSAYADVLEELEGGSDEIKNPNDTSEILEDNKNVSLSEDDTAEENEYITSLEKDGSEQPDDNGKDSEKVTKG